ncbi:phosphatase and actin regulator 3 isoform X1 [Malaclemys terrapin pileata]|uniref:phosphatase and actin regulator 3 isoform X1 n=1 Tax=Malaclemys terrapin pileata TaxID=2991368 RepID=UPI001C67D35B|nr:phosphatase and actin regulator 3 isoform X1 [Chrysemys picta bellii]XP_053901700.1 phosphatase and actin regulator 3 isoform X1 [Malaclemys terrapin pileata]
MAAAEEGTGCFLPRGRSQSDPSVLTDCAAPEAGENPDEMEQSPAMHSEYLVSGIRTPPVRRNSKLATLGRIFKPWKWRKKKNEKLKQTSAVLEKKITARPGRDELIKKGLLEMMEQDAGGKACAADGATRSMQSDPSSPVCQALTSEEMQQESTAATTNATSFSEELHSEELKDDAAKKPSLSTEELEDACLPVTEETPQALLISESTDSPQKPMERNLAQLPSPPSLPIPPPKAISKIKSVTAAGSEVDEPAVKSPPSTILKNYVIVGSSQISGQAALFHPSGQKGSDPHVRGQLPTPTGSPHPAAVHLPLPPSRVIEELHRALATKHRQDSFHGRESKGSPKKRVDVRPSRTSSIEGSKEKENALSHSNDPENKRNSVKESDENKENLIMNSELKDNLVFYQDEEVLNDSIISGTLPRKCKKELLAVKLRNRPSKQELEDRNIFPRRTDEERQEIRQQIEMKLSKRLSQRPAVEELERRNILKQRNDQTEQEERREIKQRLTRKLNQRPTVDELRDRKILIRFSDYVEVAKAQDYDRRADKPWTRLSAADKAAIRKELNEYKSNEMEVHASSKHLTRFHRP